jgi:TetR/AcrR family transcriptional regulator, transcriptional repressor for nem operon
MRKSRSETALTRAKIIEAAGQVFRRNGIAASGIDLVVAEAGLTAGGFYKHFASKDELISEACDRVLNETVDVLRVEAEAVPQQKRLELILSSYMSLDHRNSARDGCGFAALGAEMGRRKELAPVCTAALTKFVKLVEECLPSAAIDRSKKARAITSGMVGALMLARTVDDDMAELILADTKRQLLRLALD